MMGDHFDVVLNTPAGRLTTAIDVPTGTLPISALIPITRRLGEEAARLEIHQAQGTGASISCQQGCAACCRMLVPLSPPEAFALRTYMAQLPPAPRAAHHARLQATKTRLLQGNLWGKLCAVAAAPMPLTDAALEPLNQTYYAARIPCPFLVDEQCSIYEARPAACRELLVTSPAALCQDLVKNPVTPLPVSLRMGTLLGLLWGTLTDTPPRLIPLPLALEWAEEHATEGQRTWPATALFDQMLETLWRGLSHAFTDRRGSPP